jgi:CubicO group peptidase (beta-lactamase class C family)
MKRLDKDLLKRNVEKIAEYDFSHNKVFGSAYCVIQDGEIAYKNCFGKTSVDGTELVSENTLFRLASMTKPISAFATLKLVDSGIISLDDSVSDILPEFKKIHVTEINALGDIIDHGEAKNDIKIYHILSHTSGIGSDTEKIIRMTDKDRETIENTVEYYAKIGLDYDPGTKQMYSGTVAFDVLVKIIEKVMGMDYHEFLKREVFEPCGMVNTTFVPTKKQWNQIIHMHNKCDGKNTTVEMMENCVFGDYQCTHYLGGAGLVSSLADYSRFALMLLNKGKVGNKRLISEATLNKMSTPFVSDEVMHGSERWGLGVRVIVDGECGDLPIGTFGWSGAYGSHFWVDPVNKITAVFMKNSFFDGGAGNESARNFEKAVNEALV